MSKATRKKVNNILAVTTKFKQKTKDGWLWCITRVYIDGEYIGKAKYAGVNDVWYIVREVLHKEKFTPTLLTYEQWVDWRREDRIDLDTLDITVGSRKSL